MISIPDQTLRDEINRRRFHPKFTRTAFAKTVMLYFLKYKNASQISADSKTLLHLILLKLFDIKFAYVGFRTVYK